MNEPADVRIPVSPLLTRGLLQFMIGAANVPFAAPVILFTALSADAWA
ncbi:MAG: hypothetical protein ACRD6X_18555 [Pyrinomonadaceae bacterium]